MTDGLMAEAIAVKAKLENARNEANEENAKNLLDKTMPFQIELDKLVQAMDAARYSKTSIADALNESRTTIYARIERIPGEGIKSKPKAPSNTRQPNKNVVANSVDRYRLGSVNTATGNHVVRVTYDNFGPLELTGKVDFDMVHESDDNSYWLMSLGDAETREGGRIIDALDSQFTGFYYDDFKAWTEDAL